MGRNMLSSVAYALLAMALAGAWCPAPADHEVRALLLRAPGDAGARRLAPGGQEREDVAQLRALVDAMLAKPQSAEIGPQVRLMAYALVGGWLGDPRAQDGCIQMLELVLARPSWRNSANTAHAADLDVAEIAGACALACQWLGDRVPGDLLRRVSDRVRAEAFDPLLALHQTGGFPIGDFTNNWCSVVCCWTGLAAVLAAETTPEATKVVEIADEQLRGVLRCADPSGGWPEGLSYFDYALVPILAYADARRARGGPDFLASPALRAAGEFFLHLHLPPSSFALVADSSSKRVSRGVVHALASVAARGDLQWLAGRYPTQSGYAPNLLFYDPSLAESAPRCPPAKRFTGINWASLRSGWDDDARVLVMSSGYLTHHSHLDANHFLLHAYGETLMPDWGRRPDPVDYYNEGGKARYWWSDTRGHNAILMDGKGQLCDRGEHSHITHFLNGPHCDYVRSDATAVYPEKANAVVRDILFIRPDYFVVLDELSARWKTRWEWLCQYTGQLTVDETGATLAGDRAALRIETLWGRAWEAREQEHPRGDRYVSFEVTEPVPEALLATVLYPWPLDQRGPDAPTCPARLVHSLGGAGVEVTRAEGAVDRIVWGSNADGQGPPTVAVVTHSAEGRLAGFSGFGIRRLSDGGHVLLRSGTPLWASVDVGAGAAHASILVAEPKQTIEVHCPDAPESITVDGQGQAVRFDAATGLVELTLAEGSHEVRIEPGE